MKKRGQARGWGLVVAAAALLLGLAGPARAARMTAPNGPHRVGFRIELVEFEGRSMAMAVWYPALPGPSARPYHYDRGLYGSAVLDAPADRAGAPYPLIIYSHGGICCGIQSLFYTENLASYGYVVAAPDHQDSWNCKSDSGPVRADQFGWSITSLGHRYQPAGRRVAQAVLDTYDWRFRIREISAAIDYLLAANSRPGPAQGLIDPEKIGMTGHSVGGWDALMEAGTVIDCRPDAPPSAPSAVPKRVDLCSLDAYRGQRTSLRDPRVKAVLALSPAIWDLPDNGGEAAVSVPMMIITGDRRDITPADILDSYNHLPAPRYLLFVTGADHFVVEDLFVSRLAWRYFYRNAWFHYREIQQVYMNYSANFFNAYLKAELHRRGPVAAGETQRHAVGGLITSMLTSLNLSSRWNMLIRDEMVE